MKVRIPSPLVSYTHKREVDAEGRTLGELLGDLDQRYPGLRFRMIDEQGALRPHMRMFVNGEQVRELSIQLRSSDEVQFIQALSGG
ncbi:MAG: MoaD/ThiS family protein [Planctomycetes bacterium]|nr:MoaD/ThiS family protein [Planctomycetota bacterium]